MGSITATIWQSISSVGLPHGKFTPLLARPNLPLCWATIARWTDPSPLSFCFHFLCLSCSVSHVSALADCIPKCSLLFQLEASGDTCRTAEEQEEKEGSSPAAHWRAISLAVPVRSRDVILLRPFITRAVDGSSLCKASRSFTIFCWFTQPNPQLCKRSVYWTLFN